MLWGAVTAALTAAFYAALLVHPPAPCGADGSFCADPPARACARLRAHLGAHLHGQDAARDLLADAVCDHLADPNPGKPLVLSLHGSPGVGKSYFHQILAQALYDATDLEDEDANLDDDASRRRTLGDGRGGGDAGEPEPPEPSRRTDEGARARDAADSPRSLSALALAARDGAARAFSLAAAFGGFAGGVGPGPSSAAGSPRPSPSATRSRRLRPRRCPGSDCPGYLLVFGADYVTSEARAQARALRDAVFAHLSRFPESVVVIEEYDKMSCPARGVLKQLLDKGRDAEVAFHRSVFVLEANVGFVKIKKTLDERTREKTTREDDTRTSHFSDASLTADEMTRAQRTLRDVVFERWASEGCEDRWDTAKAVGAVDHFAPFSPMTRRAVERVIRSQLEERARAKKEAGEVREMTWEEPAVVKFLASRVEFEGAYAIEGGKEARSTISRFATRATTRLAAARGGEGLGGVRVHLWVAPGGRELVASERASDREEGGGGKEEEGGRPRSERASDGP